MAADPRFDILSMVFAGNYAGAANALRTGWSDALIGLVHAAVLQGARASQEISSSSVMIGTGSKTFQLAAAHGWKSGTPVRIMSSAAPTTNFMDGALSADESGTASITVNVTAATGSGTFASWTILVLASATTVASPPLGESGGGTGATTFAVARTNQQVPRMRRVKSRLDTPPGSPSSGDIHLVGASPTGAFATHAEAWATWGGASWTFETPGQGDLTIETDAGTGRVFRMLDSVNQVLSGASGLALGPYNSDQTLTAASWAGSGRVVVRTKDNNVILTIPLASAAPGKSIRVRHSSTGNFTIRTSDLNVVISGFTTTVELFAFSTPTLTEWVTVG
jgi:Protein of unknown function (DUF2793)